MDATIYDIPKIHYVYSQRQSKLLHSEKRRTYLSTSVNITKVLKVSVEHVPQGAPCFDGAAAVQFNGDLCLSVCHSASFICGLA